MKFLNRHEDLIDGRFQQAGHDFWLTRNRHGAGFWEVSYWPKEVGDVLTKTAHEFGEISLYVGDDGLLYFA